MVVKNETEVLELMGIIESPEYEGFKAFPVMPMPGISLDWSIRFYYSFIVKEELYGMIENRFFDSENLKPWTYDDFRKDQVLALKTHLGWLDDFDELIELFIDKYLLDEGYRVPDEKLLGLCNEISNYLPGLHNAIYGDLSEDPVSKNIKDTLIVSQAMASRIVYSHCSFASIQTHYSREIFEAFIDNYRERQINMAPKYAPEILARCERAYKEIDLLVD